ncbi:hypothetical protein PILCRDRAFT_825784 [Piloderma croceum F 1598]|uniref:Uncharacterized protein n=1 Tax=Piloderma croceum (strain F 1598) TaxID=765440 RepID=A0A0C3ASV9_PILCF|nr:hypothetical protein PILCRDRAFT_825784 [Piloderma croceum F 1598]
MAPTSTTYQRRDESFQTMHCIPYQIVHCIVLKFTQRSKRGNATTAPSGESANRGKTLDQKDVADERIRLHEKPAKDRTRKHIGCRNV